jgi:UDP:flavonoid glycosyltransferase YjiC (YdhE family)
MPYGLFTAIPFVGHLNPLLRQAEELQRRGWRVGVAAMREMGAHIAAEAPGVPFVDLGPLGELHEVLRRAETEACADQNYRRGGLRLMSALSRLWAPMFDGLVAEITRDRPDLLMVDIFTWPGIAAAEKTRTPLAVNNPSLLTGVPFGLMPPAPQVPLLMTGQSIHRIGAVQAALDPIIRRLMFVVLSHTVGRQYHALRSSRHLPVVGLDESLRRVLILVNGAFGLEYPRPLPANVEMVGPMLSADVPALPQELDDWLANGPPVVYVNLGTVSIASAPQLATMAAALTGDDWRALWVLKPAQAALLPGPLPASVRVTNWVPSPRAVLAHPNVRVFLTHCGINSVHESLVAGTPMVGIPMLADQRDMAVRVADAGAGLWLEKSQFTADALRRAITRVLREPSFRAPIPALQEAFVRAGGAARAADLIEREAAAHAARQSAGAGDWIQAAGVTGGGVRPPA